MPMQPRKHPVLPELKPYLHMPQDGGWHYAMMTKVQPAGMLCMHGAHVQPPREQAGLSGMPATARQQLQRSSAAQRAGRAGLLLRTSQALRAARGQQVKRGPTAAQKGRQKPVPHAPRDQSIRAIEFSAGMRRCAC